jgi:endonuclease III
MPGSRRDGKPAEKAPRAAVKKQARPGTKAQAARPGAARPGTEAQAARPGAALVRRAASIASSLTAAYPDARCMLDHADPFQLLIATILAAQCTDERVNLTTPALFARFPSPRAMAQADIGELESLVRSTGFFHSKAKSIKGAAEALAARFPARFPDAMEDLLTLPGVGRKTANVVLGTCFGAPALSVDTHMRRVAQRLGLTASDDPDQIERDLAALLPPARWTAFSNAMTFHGRRCCAARKPDHAACPVRGLCPSAEDP